MSVNQDRTTNRVALCSAIFAGFAYVGYAVVRQAFGRRLAGVGVFKNEEDALGLEYEDMQTTAAKGGRVYLRRLSGSAAGSTKSTAGSDIFGGSDPQQAMNGGCILRPLSVRERIRELNLNALAFADTVLALQGKKALSGPRSLQCSPFHSPTRIMSPLDINHIMHRDEDADEERRSCPNTPKLSRRASRRNLPGGRRSLASSIVNLSEAQQEEADARAEYLLQERERELTDRLERLQSGKSRELTPYECKSLVALLHSSTSDKVVRTLVTVSNAAAFTRNQDNLREAGVLVRLPSLLASRDKDVTTAAVVAAANLSLNIGNMKEMGQCVSVLVLLAENNDDDPDLHLSVLECLTNMAVLPDWHHLFPPLLPRILHNLTSNHLSIRIQSLRLLINLGCNDEMIPAILSTNYSPNLSSLIAAHVQEEELLRSCTFLANLCCAASRLGIADPGDEQTFQHRLFLQDSNILVNQANNLLKTHKSSEIKYQARKIETVLNGLRHTS